MARSQEALLRRAAKRSVSVEDQRQNDKKKPKHEKNSDVNGKTGEEVKTSTSKKNENDWKCSGCNFDNYASRSVCKQCNRDKNGVMKEKVTPATNKPIKELSVKPTKKPVAEVETTKPAIFDTNDWVCLKCRNKNFAHRSVCNRCDSAKPVETVSESSGSIIATTVVASSASTTKPIVDRKQHDRPKPINSTNSYSSNSGNSNNVKSQKKSNWGVQAGTEKIEENKLLLEIIQSRSKGDDDNNKSGEQLSTAWLQLTDEEKERAKVLLMRKQRKEKKTKKMQIIKSKKAAAKGTK